MGKENTIRTGTTFSSKNLGTSAHSSTLRSILPSHLVNYGIVRAVNPTTREIRYTPIVNNVASNKTGTAIPISTNTIHLPKPGYIVRIEVGPSTDISTPGSSGSQTVYYDPSPVGVWQTVDNNQINVSSTQSPLTPIQNLDKNNIQQSQIGIPHNSVITP
jgi:hypothetical protein